MQFTVGEKVRFINESGTGIIKKIIDSNTYIVEDDTGFDIEIKFKELVKIHSDVYPDTPADPEPCYRSIPRLDYGKEIDLHIHQLIEDETNLLSHEKLLLQLSSLANYINDYILPERISEFVVIHGVGKGALKSEIYHYFLNKKGFFICDADYRKYGKGATKVKVKHTMIE